MLFHLVNIKINSIHKWQIWLQRGWDVDERKKMSQCIAMALKHFLRQKIKKKKSDEGISRKLSPKEAGEAKVKKGDFWSEKNIHSSLFPRYYWNYLYTLIYFQCYTSMGHEQCLMSFFLKLLPSAAITNGDKNRTLARKLRSGICGLIFLLILSNFLSQEKLTHKKKLSSFSKLEFLND